MQGLTAGNCDTSLGTTLTTVDGLIGFEVDAMGALGSELITVAADRDFSSDTGFWLKDAGVTISGGTANWAATGTDYAIYKSGFFPANTYLEITFTITSISGGGIRVYANGNYTPARTAVGTYTGRIVSGGTAALGFYASAAGTTASVDNVSVKVVTGIHALQATAESRPTLRRTGSVYWLDTTGGTKSIGVTFPAGWESAIVIDAAKTGATVATAQNIAGAYSDTTDTCGRIFIPGTVASPATLTTAETALLTSYANRLAGL